MTIVKHGTSTYKETAETNYDKFISNASWCIMMHHDASWCIQKSVKDPKNVRQDKGIRFKRFTVEVLLSILSAGRRAPGCLFMRMLQSPMRFLPQQLSIQSLVTVMAVVRFQRVSNMSPDRKNISEWIGSGNFRGFFWGRKCFPASLCFAYLLVETWTHSLCKFLRFESRPENNLKKSTTI